MQNQIPNNWQKVKLGNVLAESPQYGYTASSTMSKIGPKLLRITDIQDDFVDWENVPYCKISEKDKSKYLLETGDIVFARTGNTTGANFYLNNSLREEAVFASYLIRVRPDNKQCLPEYLAYFFRSRSYWGQVKNLLSGSAQPGINASNLQNLTFDLPKDIETQKKIASVLSTFDDKIEINNKIAKTLEGMAQALFKEWFVKFQFPGYEKTEFIDSELGKIPKGWRVGLVKDFGRVITGKTPSTRDSSNFGSDYPFITIPDMDNTFIVKTERFLSKKAVEKMSGMLLPQNSICVSCIATVGLVGITTKESLSNQQINSIVPAQDFYIYYLYKIFKSMKKDLELRGSGGTATLIINKSKFENIELVIPNNDILLQFDKLVRPMYGKVLKITEENQKLATLRDLLLPKLMKGEIRV